MRSPSAPLDLTLSHLERSNSRSLEFWSLISHNGYLGHVLLLNIHRKPYMASPMPPSHLTLSDLERSSQGHYILKPYILQTSVVRPYVTIKR